MNQYAAPRPIKSYHLINNHRLSSSKLELQQNGKTILWVKDKSGTKMEIRLHSGGEKGPIIATSRLKSSKPGCKIILGESNKVPRSQWCYVDGRGEVFEFRYQMRMFAWRETSDETFSLVELSSNPNLPLVKYEHTKKTLGRPNIARIDFMVELGRDLELMSITSLLGLVSQMQWNPAVAVVGAAPVMASSAAC